MTSTSDSSYPRTVVDERGDTFELGEKPLGKGGQGVVFRAKNISDVAVKFCSTNKSSSADARKKLRRRLEDVRILPLDGINLARPLELLRGDDVVGYTMRLLQDMVPIGDLIATDGTKHVVEFYLEHDGLKRRLRLLEKAASTLARLHATPLVYGDVSAQNVFVSESNEADELWLIDSDNLAYLHDSSRGIYTPMFGAPELIGGRSGVDTLTDVYSFAILAFWVLVQSHPFLGDAVESGGWDETGAVTDNEELAMAGNLPFVDDPDDRSNRGLHGFSAQPELVLSPTLRKLFRAMFTEGRTNPLARPGAAQFARAFRSAANMTVRCPSCSSTYYVTAKSCPWCGAEKTRPDVIFVEARRWVPELDKEDWNSLYADNPNSSRVVDIAAPSTLKSHTVAALPSHYDDEPELRLEVVSDGVTIERLSDREFWLVSSSDSEPVRLVKQKTLPLPQADKRWHLHCGPLDESHRLLSFQFFPGDAAQ